MKTGLFKLTNSDPIYYFAYIVDNTVIGGSWKEEDVAETLGSTSWSVQRWRSFIAGEEKLVKELNMSDYKKEIDSVRKNIIIGLFTDWTTFY